MSSRTLALALLLLAVPASAEEPTTFFSPCDPGYISVYGEGGKPSMYVLHSCFEKVPCTRETLIAALNVELLARQIPATIFLPNTPSWNLRKAADAYDQREAEVTALRVLLASCELKEQP